MSVTRIVSALLMLIALGLTGCKSADSAYNTSANGTYNSSSMASYPETGNGN
ncbi:hypothetical protein [Candidimonas sp. SYP-B2681]|uniref:hypothetical protein n=1 Tax=Candidimonas sp. SYP-B2681 TaxID=2497686 RepID=UPI0013152813|nr:hypothetical protein [Candidimonas sp. SYP-B2681]